jgi:shikimate kinase
MSKTNSDIILIGPVRTGKSTLGKLLSETLGQPQVSLDKLRLNYYQQIGYNETLAKSFRQSGGFLALFLYWNLFDSYAIERMLAEHHNCIFDFGAGNGITESLESFDRLQRALNPYPNIFLILPSPDLEESLQILKNRDSNPPEDLNFDLNRYFLEHRAYYILAKHSVFTKGKLPEETRDEILNIVVK